MNQTKIGQFIAQCRKECGLTQEQLAEELGVSSRAVSKWERGLNLPEMASLFKLAQLFDVQLNELLSGEKINRDQYMERAEKNLALLRARVETLSRKMRFYEQGMLGMATVVPLVMSIVAVTSVSDSWAKGLMIALAVAMFAVVLVAVATIELRLRREIPYDECAECHFKYTPTKRQMAWSIPLTHKRYMKCPKCGKRNWHIETTKDFWSSEQK